MKRVIVYLVLAAAALGGYRTWRFMHVRHYS
jgi:hypothetical protein